MSTPSFDLEKFQANLLELSRLAEETAHSLGAEVERAAELILTSLRQGGKVLACGNGGSASDAQHFIGEMVGRFMYDRPSLPGITLSTDIAVTSAICNDYGYESVFARQIEGLGRKGDVLVALSTSGSSPNIARAVEQAGRMGIGTILLAGAKQTPVMEQCNVVLRVASTCTPRIQEIHTALYHAICENVEHGMFPQD